jgi:hypothetical protein
MLWTNLKKETYSDMMMDRREVLKSVGLIVGGSIVGAEAFLTGCSNKKQDGFLSIDQMRILEEIAEVILPKTEGSPGAKDATVGQFMNNIVTDFYTNAEQQVFARAILSLEKSEFSAMSSEDKIQYVKQLEIEVKKKPKEVYKIEKENMEQEKFETIHPYLMIKQLTIWGYLASEIVANNNFNFLPIPGHYESCVQVTDEVKPMYNNTSEGGAKGIANRFLKA